MSVCEGVGRSPVSVYECVGTWENSTCYDTILHLNSQVLGDYQNGLGETLQGLEEGEEDYDGEREKDEERDRIALVLRKAQVTVAEVQELLSTGQSKRETQ